MPVRFKTIREFFDDPKAHAAWTATITGGIIVFTTPGTMKEKAPYIADYVWGLFGVWSAVIIAKGYEKGKSLEGTVPEGRVAAPAAPANTTNVNLGGPTTGDVSISNSQPVPAATPGATNKTSAEIDADTAAKLAALAAGHSIRRKDSL
jgi:hypothetical protein